MKSSLAEDLRNIANTSNELLKSLSESQTIIKNISRSLINGEKRFTFAVALKPSLGIALGANKSKKIIVNDFKKFPDGSKYPSEAAGLQLGDVIEFINGQVPPNDPGLLVRAMNEIDPVVLTIIRRKLSPTDVKTIYLASKSIKMNQLMLTINWTESAGLGLALENQFGKILITDVKNPSLMAGVQVGDVLTLINGRTPPKSPPDLVAALKESNPVEITIIRKTSHVTPPSEPDATEFSDIVLSPGENSEPIDGTNPTGTSNAEEEKGSDGVQLNDPAACDAAVSDPANTDQAVSDSAAIDPATFDPANTDQTVSDSAKTDPATSDPAVADPATSDPAAADPATSDPAVAEPATSDPAGNSWLSFIGL